MLVPAPSLGEGHVREYLGRNAGFLKRCEISPAPKYRSVSCQPSLSDPTGTTPAQMKSRVRIRPRLDDLSVRASEAHLATSFPQIAKSSNREHQFQLCLTVALPPGPRCQLPSIHRSHLSLRRRP